MVPAVCTVIVVGETEVARLACTALTQQGCAVRHLALPSADELTAALTPEVSAVAVLVRGDVTALRYALLAEHLRPAVRLVVTLFDRTVGDELVRVVPNCLVTSPADIAVPSVIGACLSDRLLAVDGGVSPAVVVEGDPDDPEEREWDRPSGPLARFAALLGRQLRPHESSGRILLTGLGALVATLLVDWALGVALLHESFLHAFYASARVLATVGPASVENDVPSWYLVVSAALMLLTIASTAVFTAGLVNRLLSPRFTSIVGRRALPRDGHVVVIGLGQVGVRLCTQLLALGIPVVGVERVLAADGLRRVRALGIPAVIGDGTDRALLERLGLRRARALAAMGSEDLDNVATAIAARVVAPELRVVIRAGDDEVVAETQSLFSIAQVRHVSALTAAAVATALTDSPPRRVYQDGHRLVVAHDGGTGSASRSPGAAARPIRPERPLGPPRPGRTSLATI